VARERVDVAMLGTTARRRGDEDDVRPSLLSRISQNRQQRAAAAAAAAAAASALPRLMKHSTPWLLAAAATIDSRTKERKLIAALKHKKKHNSEGWLRNLEFKLDRASAPKKFVSSDSKPKLQLTDKEKEKAVKLLLAARPHDSAIPLVAHAWGVTDRAVRGWNQKLLNHPGTKIERKTRTDAGKTLIASDGKRRSVHTPRFVFAKRQRQENPDQVFSKANIDQAWAAASDDTRK
jgi:hypothetical protein